MGLGIKKALKGYINNKRIEKQIQFERGHEEYLVMNSIPANVRKPLTDQEKQAAIDLWGKAVPAPYSWKEFEVYKFAWLLDKGSYKIPTFFR